MSGNDDTNKDPGLKNMVTLGIILGVFFVLFGAYLQENFGA